MKILHLISQAPDFTGSGKYIQAMLQCAARNGHQNYLIAGVQNNFSMDGDIIAKEKCGFIWFNGGDLPYPLPGMSDAMPYESTLFSSMPPSQIHAYESAFKGAIAQGIEKFQPDVIHSHHLWLVSAMACEVAPDIPMVTTCHGTCLRQYSLCPSLGVRVGRSCRNINRIIALSRYQQQEIEHIHSIPPDRIDVIPGGYDDKLFYPGEKPLPFSSDSSCSSGFVEILYAGKLCRAKGVPWLLRSLKQVDPQRCPWRLHLTGSGSGVEQELCLELARKLGPRVVVHGALPHKELADLMGKCHIFVLPSFFEGLPLVLMEALACGCRVLTTDLPGTCEVLGTGAGRDRRVNQMENGAKIREPANGQLISLIELPELETVDKPFDSDMPMLEQRLKLCLEQLIETVMKNPMPDLELCRQMTERHSWETIFDRIEQVYGKALFQHLSL